MNDELFGKLSELALINKLGVTYREFRTRLRLKWSMIWLFKKFVKRWFSHTSPLREGAVIIE
jgi:hypothetical protein